MRAIASPRALAILGPPVALAASWAVMTALWRGRQCCDVDLYDLYAQNLAHGLMPYRDFFFEYPPGALVPIALAGWLSTGSDGFRIAFELLMVASLLATQAAVRRLAGTAAAWAMVGVPLVMGPLLRDRLDLFPVALMAGGLAVLCGALTRTRVTGAMMLLALGTLTKVFPAVVALVVLAWLAGRGERRLALTGLAALVTTAAIVAVPFAVLGGHGFLDGAAFQTRRPIQVESAPAMVVRLVGGSVVTGVEGRSSQYRSAGIEGGSATLIASVFAALQAAAILACAAWAVAVGRRGAGTRALAPVAVAGVLAFMAFGKVLSPQYLIWVAPLVGLLLTRRAWPAAVVLAVAAGVTHWLYPQHYVETVVGVNPGLAGTAARDGLLVLAFGLLLAGARTRRA